MDIRENAVKVYKDTAWVWFGVIFFIAMMAWVIYLLFTSDLDLWLYVVLSVALIIISITHFFDIKKPLQQWLHLELEHNVYQLHSEEEIRDYLEKTYGYDLHKTYAYWHPIYHWESSCQGTVPQAIIAFLDSTDFEDAIRHMTISQGQLLVRLVDRELGKTAYAVVKDYKSTAAAGFWQGVAKLFGQDLKNRYDPEGADKQTERLVELWEKGEFDLFYYSIFFEWPKKTEIPSEYQ